MATTKTDARPSPTGRSATVVAAGILVSRVVGLARQRAISHYFGLTTEAADAWAAGFRIPNLLQNLFGEGALSASFIPVYSGLLAKGRRRDADAVAGAVGGLLAALVCGLAAIGVLVTPVAIGVIAPGFTGTRRDLTIQVVRILFPGAGLLVLSAWCLGILNSHRRFFLSYTAPVVWSLAMIAALLWFGPVAELSRLVVILAWASVAGSALQLLVQLPQVLRVAPHLRIGSAESWVDVRTVVRNFFPSFLSRGVVQLSAYVDTFIASWLPTGAVAALTNAQMIYTLPVSLFGISITAAELPEMAAVVAADVDAYDGLRTRLDTALRRMAFYVVPSAMAFLALGDLIAGALLQSGRFGRGDARYVWTILAGSAIGLLASTVGRLYASAFFALRDTRTPLLFAVVRVLLTTTLGYVCALPLPRWLGIEPSWGAAGLTASAGIAGWLEMVLLRRALHARIGDTGLAAGHVARLWIAALFGAGVASTIRIGMPAAGPITTALVVVAPFGAAYVAAAIGLGVGDALPDRLRSRSRRQDSSS